MLKEYYTVLEMAERVGVTPRTIRNYLKQGELKGKLVGGKWRFSSEELERFLSDQAGRPAELVKSPIQTFTNEQTLNEGEARAMFALDFQSTPVNIETLKEAVINEYNNVYQGTGRQLFFHRLSPDSASFVLLGNPLYVTRFGSWISEKTAEIQ